MTDELKYLNDKMDDLKEQINNAETANKYHDFAKQLRMIFLELLDAGFDADQALALLCAAIDA